MKENLINLSDHTEAAQHVIQPIASKKKRDSTRNIFLFGAILVLAMSAALYYLRDLGMFVIYLGGGFALLDIVLAFTLPSLFQKGTSNQSIALYQEGVGFYNKETPTVLERFIPYHCITSISTASFKADSGEQAEDITLFLDLDKMRTYPQEYYPSAHGEDSKNLDEDTYVFATFSHINAKSLIENAKAA